MSLQKMIKTISLTLLFYYDKAPLHQCVFNTVVSSFPHFVGDNGLLVCRLDNSALATEKESRLLLYQDMNSDLDNLSCSERLSRAQFTSEN